MIIEVDTRFIKCIKCDDEGTYHQKVTNHQFVLTRCSDCTRYADMQELANQVYFKDQLRMQKNQSKMFKKLQKSDHFERNKFHKSLIKALNKAYER